MISLQETQVVKVQLPLNLTKLRKNVSIVHAVTTLEAPLVIYPALTPHVLLQLVFPWIL